MTNDEHSRFQEAKKVQPRQGFKTSCSARPLGIGKSGQQGHDEGSEACGNQEE
ncbi:hypothetical protein KAI37_02655 [Paenibacillus sp. S25]|nr:hypothetical protein KAI37_02655 [Paenibacillus sp. S25]